MKTVEKRNGKVVNVWHNKECARKSKVPPDCIVDVKDDDKDLVAFRLAEKNKPKSKPERELIAELRAEFDALRARIAVLESKQARAETGVSEEMSQ